MGRGRPAARTASLDPREWPPDLLGVFHKIDDRDIDPPRTMDNAEAPLHVLGASVDPNLALLTDGVNGLPRQTEQCGSAPWRDYLPVEFLK
jgi:hypothetical protein